MLSTLYCSHRLSTSKLFSRSIQTSALNEITTNGLYVNYFPSRKCNYKCGFCFHTATSNEYLPLKDAKRGLSQLAAYGLKKINFAGGEPFMIERGSYLGELCKFTKTELTSNRSDHTPESPMTSIVSNGSLIKEKWMDTYAEYVDMIAISVDSFDPVTNIKIGRTNGSRQKQSAIAYKVAAMCRDHGVHFKMNTVVNSLNWNEDMRSHIIALAPMRWKIFQCLLLEGENVGPEALRDATEFVVDDDKFMKFVKRHEGIECGVVENNDTMRNSYLLIDEKFRFLDCRNGKKVPTESILDVGVETALDQVYFDEPAFHRRGGEFELK